MDDTEREGEKGRGGGRQREKGRERRSVRTKSEESRAKESGSERASVRERESESEKARGRKRKEENRREKSTRRRKRDVLQCVAVRCSALQCTAVRYSVLIDEHQTELQIINNKPFKKQICLVPLQLEKRKSTCNVSKAAVGACAHRATLQHTATHCNRLQQIAAHSNT